SYRRKSRSHPTIRCAAYGWPTARFRSHGRAERPEPRELVAALRCRRDRENSTISAGQDFRAVGEPIALALADGVARDSLEASLKSTCLAQALRLPPALTTRGRLSGLSVPFHPPTHGFLDTGRVKGFFVSTRLEGDGYKFPNRSSVEPCLPIGDRQAPPARRVAAAIAG